MREKKQFLKLYGVSVPAILYNHIKRVTDILALQTYTNIPIAEARRRAVLVAMEAFAKMAKWNKEKK